MAMEAAWELGAAGDKRSLMLKVKVKENLFQAGVVKPQLLSVSFGCQSPSDPCGGLFLASFAC